MRRRNVIFPCLFFLRVSHCFLESIVWAAARSRLIRSSCQMDDRNFNERPTEILRKDPAPETAKFEHIKAQTGIEISEAVNTGQKDTVSDGTSAALWELDLKQTLEKVRHGHVNKALTISSAEVFHGPAVRAVTIRTAYAVQNRYGGYDPMAFGAYKRFQRGSRPSDSRGVAGARRRAGGVAAGTQGNRKGGRAGPDSFYNALRRLGSGPVDKGTPSVTGVVEPPPGQKTPVQPGRPPERRAGRTKVIRPSDIARLFPSAAAAESGTPSASALAGDFDSSEYTLEESGEGDLDPDEWYLSDRTSAMRSSRDKEGNNAGGTNSVAAQLRADAADGPNSIPQWIRDADKVGRMLRKGGSKRRRGGLSRDWRLWVGLIVALGFAAAVVNAYHVTGGFHLEQAAAVADSLTREPIM